MARFASLIALPPHDKLPVPIRPSPLSLWWESPYMQCPRGHDENETGARSCEECASPLARTCAGCGHPLSMGAVHHYEGTVTGDWIMADPCRHQLRRARGAVDWQRSVPAGTLLQRADQVIE
jgi:hypothetical protein